jgi:DNA-binding MarR family transcriptional regulator
VTTVVPVAKEVALETETLRLINLVAYAAYSRGFGRSFREATGIELPGSELRTLQALTAGTPVSIGELASMIDVDLGQASRQVTTLVEARLVDRVADPADRRRSLAILSDQGITVYNRWRGVWIQQYLEPVLLWAGDHIVTLTQWLTRVDTCLRQALQRPVTGHGLPDDWHHTAGLKSDEPSLRHYLEVMVRLVEMAGRSNGFNDLLTELRAPIRQQAYFALRLIARHGPMPISEVATRLAVDPSQASKRVRMLRQHGLVDQAVDSFDRRSAQVRVSRRGVLLVKRIHDLQLASFVSIVGEVSSDDRARWTPLMTRLLEGLSS